MTKLYKLLAPYFRPYRRIFWTGFAFMVMMNLMTYIIPQGIKHIWDEIFPRLNEPGGLVSLAVWCIGLILLALLRASFIFIMIYCYWSAGTQFVYDLRNILYSKLQRLPFSFYDTARTGDIMSRLTLDLEQLRNFYAFQIEHRVQITMYLSIVAILLFITDWQLALACFALTPLAVVVIMKFSRKMRVAVDRRQAQAGVLNATVQENITGIRVVKAFALEDAELAKFDRENQNMLYRNLNVSKLQSFLHPFLIFCSALGTMAIIWYGGTRVIAGELTLGTLMAFISYLAIINWPLWILAPNTNQIRQAQGSADRLLQILNEPETISDPPDGGKTIPDLKGKIIFDHLSFSYKEQPVLKSIDLVMAPGEKVAIVGLTGSGKSTLIHLIPRFYDPSEGRITIDGIDLRKLNLDWWRRQVGLVLQETFLFSATIHDNIAFGVPEATRVDVEKAASDAQIHDFITALPLGYDTVIGERGIGLSGGQKQRVALARAILLNPKVLILDDSMSSVDAATESAIQQSLAVLMQNRTTILITQRLSTACMADRILVLESGMIRAQGSHEDLIVQDDLYRQLYEIQSMPEADFFEEQ